MRAPYTFFGIAIAAGFLAVIARQKSTLRFVESPLPKRSLHLPNVNVTLDKSGTGPVPRAMKDSAGWMHDSGMVAAWARLLVDVDGHRSPNGLVSNHTTIASIEDNRGRAWPAWIEPATQACYAIMPAGYADQPTKLELTLAFPSGKPIGSWKMADGAKPRPMGAGIEPVSNLSEVFPELNVTARVVIPAGGHPAHLYLDDRTPQPRQFHYRVQAIAVDYMRLRHPSPNDLDPTNPTPIQWSQDLKLSGFPVQPAPEVFWITGPGGHGWNFVHAYAKDISWVELRLERFRVRHIAKVLDVPAIVARRTDVNFTAVFLEPTDPVMIDQLSRQFRTGPFAPLDVEIVDRDLRQEGPAVSLGLAGPYPPPRIPSTDVREKRKVKIRIRASVLEGKPGDTFGPGAKTVYLRVKHEEPNVTPDRLVDVDHRKR